MKAQEIILMAASFMYINAAIASPPIYRIVDLDTLPGFSQVYPYDLNDNEVVVGSVYSEIDAGRGFIWTKAEGMRPSLPPDRNPNRRGGFITVNNKGEAVGTVSALTYPYPSRVVAIDRDQNYIFPLEDSWADRNIAWISKINDNGVILGESLPFYNNTGLVYYSPWVWRAGVGVSRILLSHISDEAHVSDINNHDQIVGTAVLDNGCGSRAFIYDLHTHRHTLITEPPRAPNKCNVRGNATGINDAGDIVGTATNPENHRDYDAFIWSASKGTRRLNNQRETIESVVPKSINGSAEVVGNFIYKADHSQFPHVFHWDEENGLVDVAERIDPTDPLRDQVLIEGYTCADTYVEHCIPRINNKGVILTTGYYKSDLQVPRGFLLEPIRP